LEQFPRHLVAVLARLIPANAVFYMEVDPNNKSSCHVGTEPYIETPEAIALWGEYGHEHPQALHVLRTGDTSARSISEVWSRRQFRDTALYGALYQPYSVQDDIALPISLAVPHIVVGWHGDSCFTARDRLLADLAAPHIRQAWQNARLVSEMRPWQLLQQGMESAASGAIFCDADGRVRFHTALARRYLAEYFGASQKPDRQLPDELQRWMRHQNAQLQKNDVPPVRLPLAVQKGNKRLTVRLLANAGANLLLLEEETSPANADMLRPLGLSRRESEVLAWVAQGKTNSEIATILAMNLGTVKKHLASIFQKLGVETRTAAAAVAIKVQSPV